MATISGTVEVINSTPTKTKFGMKDTYSFKVAGDWYRTSFKRPTFNKGDNVTFEFTKGQYGNDVDMSSIRVAGTTGPSPIEGRSAGFVPKNISGASAGGYIKPFPIPPLSGERAIVRQNALTNAREVYMGMHDKGYVIINPEAKDADVLNEIAQQIIFLARKFEAYSCGDLDALQAEEELENDSKKD